MTIDLEEEEPTGSQGKASLSGGIEIIRGFVKTLPQAPGVYRMLDAAGEAIYVGKARNLARRVANYTIVNRMPVRLQRMVSETKSMLFVRTNTEVEALLLESNLIKRLRPRYNVLLRDDKSLPFIQLSLDHDYPRLTKHRGGRDPKAAYYGPFASAGAVDRTIIALQRAFLIRSCADTIFSTRSRPCLQYQIKRCTAPCVDLVAKEAYAEQVAEARHFLEGKSRDVQEQFREAMQKSADAMDFEAAARYRDRIKALTAIQGRQDINVEGIDEADVIAAFQEGGHTAIEVFFFRSGRNYGNRSYFPAHDRNMSSGEVLQAFVTQFYEDKPTPSCIFLSHQVEDQDLIAEAFSVKAERRIAVSAPQRGDKKRLVDMALNNAREAIQRRLAESATQTKLLAGVAAVFGLAAPPQRIEVYDNSHTGGTNAIGAMIVAGPGGFQKNAYRKFNVKSELTPGDDYAMMREVLHRRFARALKEDPERKSDTWPDLVLIDGGAGQLSSAMAVMEDLGLTDVALVGVAKGPDRDAGRERFFMAGREPFTLEPRDPVMFFLQRLRDEAHRFAIGTHRAKRQKAIGASPLDDIAGIGPTRKKALLMHFGSGQAVARAGLSDLEGVSGISKAVAKMVYDHFHGGG
jgi:excinuclease ABC subunit C